MIEIQNEDLKTEVFRIECKGQHIQSRGSFVKVEHIPTGITITKFGRSQFKEKCECIEEIKKLIELGQFG